MRHEIIWENKFEMNKTLWKFFPFQNKNFDVQIYIEGNKSINLVISFFFMQILFLFTCTRFFPFIWLTTLSYCQGEWTFDRLTQINCLQTK